MNAWQFHLGFENYVYEREDDRISVYQGTVIGGTLFALRSKQLARQVTIDAGAFTDIGIRWEGGTASDPVARPVRLVALCNVYADKPIGGILRVTAKRYLASVLIDSETREYFWWDAEPEGRELFTPNIVVLFEHEMMCDRVDIELQRSSADKTARIGPVWVGPTWQPHSMSGLEGAWTMAPIDLGNVRKTAGGSAVTRPRRVLRSLAGSMAPMPYVAAFGLDSDAFSFLPPIDVQKLQHTMGTTRLVYVLPKTAAPLPHLYGIWRLGFVGHATQLGRIVKQAGDYYRWDDFVFQEVQ